MPENSALNGPTLAPASGAAPERIVILLHGVGSDGNDLIALAPYFQRVLPDALFISPNAPHAFDMAPVGHQWFSIQDFGAESRLEGARSAAPILDAFIDAQIEEHGLSADRLALMGFSQGTMMALHVGLRRERQVAGILGYSGILVGPEVLAGEIKSRPPVQLVHGDVDEVLPLQGMTLAVAGLEAVGVPVSSHVSTGLGHGIDEEGIHLGMRFLGEIFAAGNSAR